MSDNIRIFLSFVVVIAFFVAFFNRTLPRPVDVLFVNGVIYTMDAENTIADAMAVRGGRIAAAGSRRQLEEHFRPRTIVDLQGKTVFPGFIDAHAHLMSLGIARITVDLVGSTSEAEAVERVRSRVSQIQPETWVRGRGWDQNDWPGRRFPHRSALDRVSPGNPVYLTRIDGHAAWVNTLALDAAGITAETPDPPGGKIIRDASGEPTGILIDNAMSLARDVLPPPTSAEQVQALSLAIEECLSYGITGIHDMGVDISEIDLYKEFIDRNMLGIRVYAAVGGTGETWDSFLESGPLMNYGNHHLTVRALKLYVDGALGSFGAALIEPYSDDPENRGLTIVAQEDLQNAVDEALQHGFQVCTHAIGDRGNNIALNVYEQGLSKFPRPDHRLRVEHAQVLASNDIPRFRHLDVVPSMQPTHCTSDMYWSESRLGPDRVRGAYAWRSLRETGVVIPGGSDFPVEHPNPLPGIYAAVTRQDVAGYPRDAGDVRQFFQVSKAGIKNESDFEGGWYAGQSLTRLEAIQSFTTWAAWSAFEEDLKGSLETGKLADFVVLSADIMTIPPQEILRTEVERTFVGGEELFSGRTDPLSLVE